MKTFYWSGITSTGHRKKGSLQISSQTALSHILLEQGIALLNCSERTHSLFSKQSPLKTRDLISFFHHNTLLLEGGVELIASFNLLEQQTDNQTLKTICSSLTHTIQQGGLLSDGLKIHAQHFTPLMIDLVRVGEQTGNLALIFSLIHDHLQTTEQQTAKIRQAMIGPLTTLAFCGLLTIVLFVGVIPQFQDFLSTTTAQLPLLTRIILRISTAIRSPITIGIAITIAIILYALRACAPKKFQDLVSSVMLTTPLVGTIMKNICVSRFLHVTQLCLQTGMPLIHGLNAALATIHIPSLAKNMHAVINAIEHGQSLEQALMTTPQQLLEPSLLALIAAGGQTGKITQSLASITTALDQQTERTLQVCTNMLQPLLLILVGALVACVMAAIYVPIFSMAQMIHP